MQLGGAFNHNVPFEPGKLESTFYSGVNNYKTMAYIWAHRDASWGNYSILVHNDGRQITSDSSMANRQTLGLYTLVKPGAKFSLTGEFYYQMGEEGSGKSVNTLMAAVYGTFGLGKLNLTLGGDYLSGTDPRFRPPRFCCASRFVIYCLARLNR